MRDVKPIAPPAPAPGAANDSAPVLETHRFQFTGSGKEYFRIWIVGLFLSVATLGVYSAWAKVRRLQYFDRNTKLAGAVFDFDGKPVAILRGRALAAALLGVYYFAFGVSLAAGIAVVAGVLLALPSMMRASLRFRLRNTRYRGLRFSFGGTRGSFATYLTPVLMFLLPALLLAGDPSGRAVAMVFLMWPLIHVGTKRHQHQNLAFGSSASTFNVPRRRFYDPYFKAISMGILAIMAAGLVALAVTLIVHLPFGTSAGAFASLTPAFVGLASAYLIYLLAGPYLQVRIANLAWSATAFEGVTISSRLKARGFVKLQVTNSLLTLLSLGLYRPFAVVRAYRYRLDNITVSTAGRFEAAMAAIAHSQVIVGADGAAGSPASALPAKESK